jgi:hypothetical protein
MQGNQFTLSFHIPGTLAANVSMYFTVPADCQLIHVSANGSNANNGLLDIGPTSDTDGYLDGVSIGDSNTPAEFDLDDFVDAKFPHILKGTIVSIGLDYDGAGGTATHDFTLVLTFTEG